MLSLLAVGVLATSCRQRDERRDLTQYVQIYPGSPIIELPGERTEVAVTVRNVHIQKLTKLRLSVKTEAAAVAIAPAAIPELIPGDRRSFTLKLTRDTRKPRQRYPLELTLYAEGLPVPAGLDLGVDTGLPLADQGWIDVGQVTLISREDSRAVYYLLAGAPLLLVVLWLLWRYSRPRAGRKKPAAP